MAHRETPCLRPQGAWCVWSGALSQLSSGARPTIGATPPPRHSLRPSQSHGRRPSTTRSGTPAATPDPRSAGVCHDFWGPKPLEIKERGAGESQPGQGPCGAPFPPGGGGLGFGGEQIWSH